MVYQKLMYGLTGRIDEVKKMKKEQLLQVEKQLKEISKKTSRSNRKKDKYKLNELL